VSVLWEERQLLEAALLVVFILVALSNLYFLRRLGSFDPPGALPRVSVLVPARNEEQNIGRCVRSLLEQDYPDFEVMVLDDHSSDATARIVEELATGDERVKLISGAPLPGGWLGKHWACHQLAQAGKGELLLFTDADTWHHPSMLRDAVAAQAAEGADLMSALPKEVTLSWFERLVIPIISWAMLSLMPFGLAHRLRLPLLSFGIGQFMLFRRGAYVEMGGHAAIRDDVVDDLALARLCKTKGFRWRMVDGTERVYCRMYEDFSGVFHGMSKSIFPALYSRVAIFVAVFGIIGFVFLEPFIIIGLALEGVGAAPATVARALIVIALGVLSFVVAYVRFDIPWPRAFLYPLTVAAVVVIGAHSVVASLTGRAMWKDRSLAQE